MTVVLIVACLAVAAAELYMAFARRKRDSTAITDLQSTIAELREDLSALTAAHAETRAAQADHLASGQAAGRAAETLESRFTGFQSTHATALTGLLRRVTSTDATLAEHRQDLSALTAAHAKTRAAQADVEITLAELRQALSDVEVAHADPLNASLRATEHSEAATTRLQAEQDAQSQRIDDFLDALRSLRDGHTSRLETTAQALRAGTEQAVASLRHEHDDHARNFTASLEELGRAHERQTGQLNTALSDLRQRLDRSEAGWSAFEREQVAHSQHIAELLEALNALRSTPVSDAIRPREIRAAHPPHFVNGEARHEYVRNGHAQPFANAPQPNEGPHQLGDSANDATLTHPDTALTHAERVQALPSDADDSSHAQPLDGTAATDTDRPVQDDDDAPTVQNEDDARTVQGEDRGRTVQSEDGRRTIQDDDRGRTIQDDDRGRTIQDENNARIVPGEDVGLLVEDEDGVGGWQSESARMFAEVFSGREQSLAGAAELEERLEAALAELRRTASEHEASAAKLRAERDEHARRYEDALAELGRLRDEQTGRLDAAISDLRQAQEQIDAASTTDELNHVKARLGERLDTVTQRLDSGDVGLAALARRAEHLESSHDEHALDRLRQELVALQNQADLALDRLDELDAERDRDLERYRDLAQALDTVEDLVAGQRPSDTEPGTVRGGLAGDDPGSHEILTKAYENLIDAMDLRVRMQVPAGQAPWHTQYYLAGKNPARLRRDFATLLSTLHSPQPDPRKEAFQALTIELQEATQAFAQIGPLVLIKLPGTLLCGVLNIAETRRFDTDRFLSDPETTATRLRLLPTPRFHDLSQAPQPA